MTDFDSVALFASLVEIALIPIWTRWWANYFRGSRYFSVALALFAFATFALCNAAPFLVMRGAYGSFANSVTNPKFLIGLAVYACPPSALQLWYVLYFVRQQRTGRGSA